MRAFILLFSMSLMLSSHANVTVANTSKIKCKLPKNETLTIGCSNYCGRFTRWAIRRHARRLGYKVKLVNLRTNRQSIDYTKVDGIILPGGSDIDPKWYIDRVTPEFKEYLESIKHLANLSEIGRIRDEFEFKLIDDYFKNPNSKYQPILGICRGMQALTVSQGIPLYVDIKHELGIRNRRYTLDRVTIHKDESLIKEIQNRKSFLGVQLHHQGLNISYFNKHRENWPHLDVTALSNGDKVAEVLEFYNRPVLGVQFHPEWTFGRTRKNIFRWLLKRSCFNKVMSKKLTKKEKR